MNYKNEMKVKFDAVSVNEGFARIVVASFCASLNPTIDEINDIKTAVSEAVTNAVVHAYPNENKGKIEIEVKILDNEIYIAVKDFGVGISNIEKAKEPFYTTCANGDRSGMGFTVMEGFMDKMIVKSSVGLGTEIILIKQLGDNKAMTIGG